MKLLVPYLIYALLVVGGAVRHELWTDEAQTAVFARTINEFGRPMGWDGVNVLGYHGAVLLNQDLVNVGIPWPQLYLAAGAMKLLGESAAAVRVPFVVIAMVVPWLAYKLAVAVSGRRRVGVIAMWLTSLSVPLILFMYQARYYSMAVVLELIWLLLVVKRRQWRWANWGMMAVGIGLAYVHWVSLVVFWAGLAIGGSGYWAIKSGWKEMKRWLKEYAAVGAVIGLAFWPWWRYSQTAGPIAFLGKLSEVPIQWWGWLGEKIDTYREMGALPIALVAVGIYGWRWWKRQEVAGLVLLLGTVLGRWVVAAGLTATIMTPLTNFSNPRHLVAGLVLLAIAVAVVIEKLEQRYGRMVMIGTMVVLILTNGLSLAWPVRSFLWEYAGELLRPLPSPDKAVAEMLLREGKERETVFVSLERSHEPLLFYLGKKFRFVNRVHPGDKKIFPYNHDRLPRYTYFFEDKPDWVILYSQRGNDGTFWTYDYRGVFPKGLLPSVNLDRDYEEKVISIFFADVSRPEIELHAFKPIQPEYTDQIFVYHRKLAYE